MKGFLTTRIGRHFLAIFTALALPLIAAAWFGLRTVTSALEQQTHTVLRAASNAAEAQLREFLLHLKRKTLSISVNGKIREVLQPASGLSTGQLVSTDVTELLIWQQTSLPDVEEISVLTTDGRVVASSRRQNISQDWSSAAFFTRGQMSFYPGDLYREPADGQIRWVMSAPILDAAGSRPLGVVVLRVDASALSDLTTGRRIIAEGADSQSFRIGNTGETYIVNRNRLMITESRDLPDSILKVKVDTLPVRTALEEGREITGDYRDYRGVNVSGASTFLRDIHWVVLTEIDFSQVFAPIRRLRNVLIWLALGLGLVAMAVTWGWIRAIIRPLSMVSNADIALATGNETEAIVPEENLPANEVGDFVRKRNARIKQLIDRQRALALEQKRRAEAAAELERMSYSMVHDMRAPLRAIISFGGMLEAEAAEWLTDETRNYIQRMRIAAARMDRLLSDMLRYSAFTGEEWPLQPVNISEVLREIIETYPMFQPHKNNIRVPADLPIVRGNEAALTQCFSSLLANAITYVRPGEVPQVNVRAECNNDLVRIFVEDNGIGIGPEVQGKIFDIFHRGTNEQEGTGIGLAIVRIAALRMGGRVGVISEPGHGSQFCLELRLAGEENSPASREQE
jgi:signal transduction histidine kinase